MKMAAMKWLKLNSFWAGTQRSAMMPMMAGMKSDTMPCMA